MNICENYGMLLDTQSTVANLCQGRRNRGKDRWVNRTSRFIWIYSNRGERQLMSTWLIPALSRFKDLPTDLFVYVPQARSSHKKIFKNQSSRLSYMYNRELALDWRNTLSKIIKNSSNAWCYYWICVFLLSLNSIFVWVMYF